MGGYDIVNPLEIRYSGTSQGYISHLRTNATNANVAPYLMMGRDASDRFSLQSIHNAAGALTQLNINTISTGGVSTAGFGDIVFRPDDVEKMRLNAAGLLTHTGNTEHTGTLRIISAAVCQLFMQNGARTWQFLGDNAPDFLGLYDGAAYDMKWFPDRHVEVYGEFDLTGALACIDLNPAGTGTKNIIDIAPSAGLAAAATWKGIYLDGSLLDPSGAGATIYGLHVAFAGISLANNPNIYGIYVGMPAAYAAGNEQAAYFGGDGRVVRICTDTYALHVDTGDTLFDANVSIGTTSTDRILHVLEDTYGQIWVEGTHADKYGGIAFENDNADVGAVGVGGTNQGTVEVRGELFLDSPGSYVVTLDPVRTSAIHAYGDADHKIVMDPAANEIHIYPGDDASYEHFIFQSNADHTSAASPRFYPEIDGHGYVGLPANELWYLYARNVIRNGAALDYLDDLAIIDNISTLKDDKGDIVLNDKNLPLIDVKSLPDFLRADKTDPTYSELKDTFKVPKAHIDLGLWTDLAIGGVKQLHQKVKDLTETVALQGEEILRLREIN